MFIAISTRFSALMFLVGCWMTYCGEFVLAPPPPPSNDNFIYQSQQTIRGLVGSSANFGSCAAIPGDGNTAVIGGYLDDRAEGAVWVYVRLPNSTWVQQGDKIIPDDTPSYQFGMACAISFRGDTVVVGGMNQADDIGAVWSFIRLPNGTWTQQENAIVGNDFVGPVVLQGYSVALSADGNTLLSGAQGDNTFNGAVWVFNRSVITDSWTQVNDKLAPTDATFAFFGCSVSLSADASIALVGGNNDFAGVGAVWIFKLVSEGTYIESQSKLVPTDSVGASFFGRSVAISADASTAVIGGDGDDSPVGASWVFQALPNGTFVQVGNKLLGYDTVSAPGQGHAVSTNHDGSIVITGGWGDDNYAGATWVYYRYENQTYLQQEAKFQLGDGTRYQGFGLSMSFDGKRFISGQPDADASDGSVTFWEFLDLNPSLK